MSEHGGFSFEPYVVVACFLVREGGDIYMKNYQGISPIQLAPPDIGNVIAGFFRGYATICVACVYSTASSPGFFV